MHYLQPLVSLFGLLALGASTPAPLGILDRSSADSTAVTGKYFLKTKVISGNMNKDGTSPTSQNPEIAGV
jgi:hypothetical protein